MPALQVFKVNFTQVDAQFRIPLTPEAPTSVQPGGSVHLVDDAGHSCAAVITAVHGGQVIAELLTETFEP